MQDKSVWAVVKVEVGVHSENDQWSLTIDHSLWNMFCAT